MDFILLYIINEFFFHNIEYVDLTLRFQIG